MTGGPVCGVGRLPPHSGVQQHASLLGNRAPCIWILLECEGVPGNDRNIAVHPELPGCTESQFEFVSSPGIPDSLDAWNCDS